MTLSDLITKLEAATEGSRELSDEVLLACGWVREGTRDPRLDCWRDPQGNVYDHWNDPHGRATQVVPRPSPTESIDAALTLVPDDWGYVSVSMLRGGSSEAFMLEKDYSPPGDGHIDDEWSQWLEKAFHTSPALAICIAALKAIEAGDGIN
jgi:hypothetical protein